MTDETMEIIAAEDEDVQAGPPPALPEGLPEDERYLRLLTAPLELCAEYRPKFGKGGKGLNLEEFRALYGADPFYHWVGLDSPLLYAAHKAAGGMTSIYRQLGIGAQWILNQVIQDRLGLSREQAAWSYAVPTANAGRTRTLSLDARIELASIEDRAIRERVAQWTSAAAERLLLPDPMRDRVKGTVFEARQGYKSKDSKRQNADIANASNAYTHDYIPVLLLFSNQLDDVLADRYAGAYWLILKGGLAGSSLDSTYVFCRDVVGYDLAAFFERNSVRIRAIMEQTLEALLTA